ncbi:MAG: hypothetical protein M3145_03685, partial [Pseudomonadota bacterium]|nr:hypothetical protein [Pseudomonadota bacterium]
LHILHLSTPLDQCLRNVVRRRRARRDTRPLISKIVAAEYERVADACHRLQSCANVEAASFDQALFRAQELLGFKPRDLVAPSTGDPLSVSPRRWFTRSTTGLSM